jgi:7,8-dihydroneopterin aldolase/epimerase/oxygenase
MPSGMLRAMKDDAMLAGYAGPLAAAGNAAPYCIFVRNLVLAARIGVHAHEKTRPPRLRIGVEIDMKGESPERDEIAAVLNYETIVEGIKRIASGGHINLVETFADRVAKLCLADRRVAGVRVSVEKLDVYPEMESVGVVIERRR